MYFSLNYWHVLQNFVLKLKSIQHISLPLFLEDTESVWLDFAFGGLKKTIRMQREDTEMHKVILTTFSSHDL